MCASNSRDVVISSLGPMRAMGPVESQSVYAKVAGLKHLLLTVFIRGLLELQVWNSRKVGKAMPNLEPASAEGSFEMAQPVILLDLEDHPNCEHNRSEEPSCLIDESGCAHGGTQVLSMKIAKLGQQL